MKLELVTIPHGKLPTYRGIKEGEYVSGNISRHSTNFTKIFGEVFNDSWNYGSKCVSDKYEQFFNDTYSFVPSLGQVIRMNRFRNDEYVRFIITSKNKEQDNTFYSPDFKLMQILESKDISLLRKKLMNPDRDFVIQYIPEVENDKHLLRKAISLLEENNCNHAADLLEKEALGRKRLMWKVFLSEDQ